MAAIAGSAPNVGAPLLREAFPRLRQLERYDRGHVDRIERIQLKARRFAEERLRPVALEIDRRTGIDPSYFDWDLVRAGARSGMLDFLLPAQLGGGGYTVAECAVVMEELCAACPGLALIFGAHGLGISPLQIDGPLHWDVMCDLVASAQGPEPLLMAAALTEPDAGTDLEDIELMASARVSSHARRVPGGYALSGTKRFISNGGVARWISVLMPVDPRRPAETYTGFLVDARSKGFSVARSEHKMGQRACPASELVFDEVFVPDERVIGRVGDGAGLIVLILCGSRPPVGAIGTGIARGAYERLLAWLRESPGDRRLLERQGVKLKLASMAERIHLSRQAYLDAAVEMDMGALGGSRRNLLMRGLQVVPNSTYQKRSVRRVLTAPRTRDALAKLINRLTDDANLTRAFGLASLAKARGGDTAMRVTDEALQIVGLLDAPIRPELEKLWRDAKLCQIYEGTNQLNRIEIYRALVARETMPILPPVRRRVDAAGLAS